MRTTIAWRRGPLVIRDGVIGGIIGGILMGMVSMVIFWLTGRGFWMPLKYIATLLMGSSAAANHGFTLWPVAVGLIVHIVLSMVFGVGMASVATHRPGQPPVKAIVLSLILWAVANLVVLPVIDRTFYDGFPAWIFAIGHPMDGVGLGGFLTDQRRQSRRDGRLNARQRATDGMARRQA